MNNLQDPINPINNYLIFDIKNMSDKLLELIPDMIFIKGPKSQLLWANQAFQNYYGMSNTQLKGIIDSPINDPDYTQQYIKDDEYVFSTGKTLNIKEEAVVRHDGDVLFFNTIKSAVRDEDGNIVMTIGISRDITERKLADEKVKRSNAELNKMNDALVNRELRMVELKRQMSATNML